MDNLMETAALEVAKIVAYGVPRRWREHPMMTILGALHHIALIAGLLIFKGSPFCCPRWWIGVGLVSAWVIVLLGRGALSVWRGYRAAKRAANFASIHEYLRRLLRDFGREWTGRRFPTGGQGGQANVVLEAWRMDSVVPVLKKMDLEKPETVKNAVRQVHNYLLTVAGVARTEGWANDRQFREFFNNMAKGLEERYDTVLDRGEDLAWEHKAEIQPLQTE